MEDLHDEATDTIITIETKKVVCVKYKDVCVLLRIWCSCGGLETNTVYNGKANMYNCIGLFNRMNQGKLVLHTKEHLASILGEIRQDSTSPIREWDPERNQSRETEEHYSWLCRSLDSRSKSGFSVGLILTVSVLLPRHQDSSDLF